MKVLIVEEDGQIRDYISMLLESGMDCEILEASSGNEALAVLEFEPGVQLLISEVLMKGGGGHLIIDHLDENQMDIPVVWLSAPANKEVQIVNEVLKRNPLSAFVAKPFKDDEFFPVIENIIETIGDVDSDSEAEETKEAKSGASVKENSVKNESSSSFEDIYQAPTKESKKGKTSAIDEDLYAREKKAPRAESEADWSIGQTGGAKSGEVEADYSLERKSKNHQEVDADYSLERKSKNHEEVAADYSLERESKNHKEVEADYSLERESKVHGEEEAGYSLERESKVHGEEEAGYSLERESKAHSEQEADWDAKAAGNSSEQEADWDAKAAGNAQEEDADWEIGKKGSAQELEADYSLKNGSKNQEAPEEEEKSEEPEDENIPGYKKIRIKRLYNFSSICCDGFIKLGPTKMVRLLGEDQPYDKALIEKYADKGIKTVYVKDERYEAFCAQFSDLVSKRLEMSKKLGGEIEAVAQLAAFENTRMLAKEFGVTEVAAAKVKESVQANLESLAKKPDLEALMNRILRGGDYISERSLLVSYFAGQICMKTSWSSSAALEKLSMAALMHDIAIDENHLAKVSRLSDQPNLTKEQIQTIKDHPGEAAKIVSQGESIFADVESIIIQHHEKPDQSGFPRGLGALSISPLSCIFILASEFAYEVYGKKKDQINIEEIKERFSSTYNAGNFKKPLQAFLAAFS